MDEGLYETLITAHLQSALGNLATNQIPLTHKLRNAEAADRLSFHLAQVVCRAIESLPDDDKLDKGYALIEELVRALKVFQGTENELPERLVDPLTLLTSVTHQNPDGSTKTIAQPLIPLLDTTLLTNSPGEPRVVSQLEAEIDSADTIELVMAFIRFSGLKPFLSRLHRHCDRGRALRVLTTTYTNSTEFTALEALHNCGADIKVSYDTSYTRLHAKSWLFQRNSGFSTAYVGSSNMTYSAQVTGMEWNVRVAEKRNPAVIEKITAVFDSYWHSDDFVHFNADEFRTRTHSTLGTTSIIISPVEIRLEPFQDRLLEQIELARQQGYHRNLLVSATGTGKTVMAAMDYARLASSLPRSRLLFIAHRREILEQSQSTFCHALRDHSFGELWIDGNKPTEYEHVFASMQSIARADLQNLSKDHFDIVIVDEFHHAAASSYTKVLEHLEPKELLGLTATPERVDGLSVLDWFDGRIAAEMRLWDAIDQHRLVPFLYFGIHDGTDLTKIPWRKGRGYDIEGLTNVLTADDALARLIIKQLIEKVSDAHTIRALGFCVSVEHARYMARVFTQSGIKSLAVWADTPKNERKLALKALADGEIQVLFSVDLFNEGVDIPVVDTLLMLRPTQSGTLFLQQLGRGLRKHASKTVCTVLDFVGQHNRKFRYDQRFKALLGGHRKHIRGQIENGLPFLPVGCHMELDAKSSDIILNSIKNALPTTFNAIAQELKTVAADTANQTITLGYFLDVSGLDLTDVYAQNRGWSDLVERAELPTEAHGEHESALRRGVGRLLHIDDEERIAFYKHCFSEPANVKIRDLPIRKKRLIRMIVSSLTSQITNKQTTLAEGWQIIVKHPQICKEISELLDVLESRIKHVQHPLENHPNVPLLIHASYTRIDILSAVGAGDENTAQARQWREGAFWATDVPADLFAFTLDKTNGQFSPTTRYKDYAINRSLIHWESQSTTSATSETGTRYQQHKQRGSSVMLFARERSDERAFLFLGTASYVSHKSERPMAITWKLDVKLPGDVYAAYAAVVA